jgi:hypothetical protein
MNGDLRRRTTREREHEKRERARLWEGELRGRDLGFIGRERERESRGEGETVGYSFKVPLMA